ncbi:AKL18 [Puccinia graminis f. sp. tritici CRL 75-36-700-3]|uniref:AKL18 n=1 Tax=Puccinia graminis f. sp. tritici (strain CRL 75-36-700-3 / race SCCL) TaxID=418459 RepID=E3KJ40_PUCGT|nr:AKL18 [Puccinia graminis f. sp. tritici CRL 75-36-700-3]EFP84315.2 AKL18 [Puccinia graminis f. sp. tritici CRL 75-36-700-3]
MNPTQAFQTKRDEAIARARNLYGTPTLPQVPAFLNRTPISTLPVSKAAEPVLNGIQVTKPVSNTTAVQAFNISQEPYHLARRQRVTPQPYPATRSSRLIAKKVIAGKGAIPLMNAPEKVQVQCGFEMWSKGRFVAGQAVIRSASWVFHADINAHQVLLQELCQKHEGNLELITKSTEDREFFSEAHFPFCRLGTRKGSVNDHESFVQFLKDNKVIDLIFDRDNFTNHSLDEEERLGMEEETRRYAASSSTALTINSHDITQNFGSAVIEPEFQAVPQNPASAIVETTLTGSDNSVALPSNASMMLSPYVVAALEEEGLLFIRKSPPWVSETILDPTDLRWNHFGTAQHSHWYCGLDDLGWVDGVRYQLEIDGLNTSQKICLYRVDYQKPLRCKKTSKVIRAEILDSGFAYPMVAEYSLVEKDLTRDTYMKEANYTMRRYAAARQFLAIFCQEIKESNASPAQKKMAKVLRVSHRISIPRTDDIFKDGQDDDFIPLPTGLDDPANIGEELMDRPEDIPTRLLHAFQHWVYVKTNGQLTLTHFKGNPPLLSHPKIIDLNPEATWSKGQDSISMMSQFIAKHECTTACLALDLSILQEIPWAPVKKAGTALGISSAANKKSVMDDEDIALVSVVRQGHKALNMSK